MMTSSTGNIFRVNGSFCGEFTGNRWISHTKPVAQSFDVFFDQRLNKRLSKQLWGWWFETPSRSLWRHCNVAPVTAFRLFSSVLFSKLGQEPHGEMSDYILLTHLPLDKMAAMLADDIFKCIFLNENDWIPIRISLKFVPRSPIDNKPALI